MKNDNDARSLKKLQLKNADDFFHKNFKNNFGEFAIVHVSSLGLEHSGLGVLTKSQSRTLRSRLHHCLYFITMLAES